MIAAIEHDGVLHIVRSTGRVRLHVEITTYCNSRYDATSVAVLQVSDDVFTKMRPDTHMGGPPLRPCPTCRGIAIG